MPHLTRWNTKESDPFGFRRGALGVIKKGGHATDPWPKSSKAKFLEALEKLKREPKTEKDRVHSGFRSWEQQEEGSGSGVPGTAIGVVGDAELTGWRCKTGD